METSVENLRQPHLASPTFNILMLHGFTQNGPLFTIKTRKLANLIRQSLLSSPDLLRRYPGGIRFMYPTAPFNLQASNTDGWAFAWWRNLDNISQYDELNQTFDFLRTYIEENGHIHGVVGFSQGASLAAMVASWCESGANPLRASALRNQLAPMTVPLPESQRPLKFVICISGFRGTEEYYSGFYSPKIQTPMLNVMGMLDGMVSEELVRDLAGTCLEQGIVCHGGGHYIPTDMHTLWALVGFVRRSVSRDDLLLIVGQDNTVWVGKEESKKERYLKTREIRTKYVARRSRQVKVVCLAA